MSVPQQMEVSVPIKSRWVPPPLKNVLSSFKEQDKVSSDRIGVSQRWPLYLLWWLCITLVDKLYMMKFGTKQFKIYITSSHQL